MRVSLFLAAAILFGSAAHTALAGPVALQAGAPGVRVAQDREACSVQADLPWCVAGEDAAGSREWTLEEVQALQTSLTGRFSYSYDPQKPWRSSYVKAAAGKSWSDDCDGLVFTMFDAMARQGFPKSKMWRAVVTPKKSASFVRHMVGIVEVGGRYYVIGDTGRSGDDDSVGAIYSLRSAEFTVDLLSQVSGGSLWRRVELNAPLMSQVSN